MLPTQFQLTHCPLHFFSLFIFKQTKLLLSFTYKHSNSLLCCQTETPHTNSFPLSPTADRRQLHLQPRPLVASGRPRNPPPPPPPSPPPILVESSSDQPLLLLPTSTSSQPPLAGRQPPRDLAVELRSTHTLITSVLRLLPVPSSTASRPGSVRLPDEPATPPPARAPPPSSVRRAPPRPEPPSHQPTPVASSTHLLEILRPTHHRRAPPVNIELRRLTRLHRCLLRLHDLAADELRAHSRPSSTPPLSSISDVAVELHQHRQDPPPPEFSSSSTSPSSPVDHDPSDSSRTASP